MAAASSISGTVQTPLLQNNDVVDYKGRPVNRSKSGRWRSASFILGLEMAERSAYIGISSTLINYLTGPLGESTATAAENVSVWFGTAQLLPLLGAFVADSFLGRYRAIIVASALYILGLGLLTLSAVIPSFTTSECGNTSENASCSPPRLQVIILFFSLYLIAIAQGLHRPCVQAFGADQFDESDPEECKANSSFFNWWWLGVSVAAAFALAILTYVQDYLGWGLGFGIPCLVMCFALVWFLLGTTTYRIRANSVQDESAFASIGQMLVKATRNWRITSSATSVEEESQRLMAHVDSQQLEFLAEALVEPDGLKKDMKVSSINAVEGAKAVHRLIPIWLSCLIYSILCSQSATMFTRQALTMNRYISSRFEVPAASLQCVIFVISILFIPVYDRILVPTARVMTGKPSGITMLQRIGTGIFVSFLAMLVAALVERKRLEIAIEHGLVDKPEATVPMNVAWLIPQYLLFGVSESLALVGLQEFFYDQVPNGLKSTGLALYLGIDGVGGYLTSFLISVIEKATGGEGRQSWFSDNLNKAHLDYFYGLLAGLGAVALIGFLYFSKVYVYGTK